jgi:hypothetical protein
LLKQLSDWFCVSTRWLEGSDPRPVYLTAFSEWIQVAMIIKKRIQEYTSDDNLTRPDIFLVRRINTPQEISKTNPDMFSFLFGAIKPLITQQFV